MMRQWLAAGVMALGAASAVGADVPEAGQMQHVVQKGDTLWDLAQDFYDDPFEWTRIWKANPFIEDPHWLYPGQTLAIPGRPTITQAPTVAPPPPADKLTEPPPPAKAEMPKPAAPVTAPGQPARAEPPPPAKAEMPKPAASVAAPGQPAPPEPALSKLQRLDLSEDFPPSQSGHEDTLPKARVPLDWKPLGRILGTDFMNATDGQEVEVQFRQDVDLTPGAWVYVVQHAGFDYDPVTRKKVGILLQNIARVRVLKVVSQRRIQGVVEKAKDGVQPGDAVQLAFQP